MPTLNLRQINGVVRTSEPVWSNLERLAEAASVWFTYDTHEGVYAWVINEAGNSVAAITEADIIGPIQISGSGLTNLYNSIEVEYPRNDMNDQPHYVTLNLPDGLRNAYEPDNTLQMSSEFINNQPQAEYVGMVTLKQSRLDRTVTIVMDYTKISLQAGDIIDITSDTYGWTAKEFRIMRVREIEGDDGSLRLEFSCTEYDDTIYDGTWDNFLVAGVPGIRSIGTIGTPATPTVAIANIQSLPTQVVTTTVPVGVVDRMQFWAGNVAITGNVANTNYNLVGTVASTNANAFTQGANVSFAATSLQDGTWSWKTRGTNNDGTGPFSTASGNVVYVRGQAPDLLKAGTAVVDQNGSFLTPVDNASWRSVGIADLLQYTGNSAYQGMIFTADTTMVGINGNVANVAYTIPTGSRNIAFDLQTTAIARQAVATAVGIDLGLAQYLSTATWNANAYIANGFSGLAWSDWTWVGGQRDESGSLSGNVSISIGGCYTSDIDDTDPTFIVAFGYSSTINPTDADFTTIVDPVSGITTIGYQVGFSGNTVIQDNTGNTLTYEVPGITAGYTLGAGAQDAFGKIRIDR